MFKLLFMIFLLMLALGYFMHGPVDESLPQERIVVERFRDHTTGTTRSHQFQQEYDEAKRKAPIGQLPLGLLLPNGKTVAEHTGIWQ